ncbi:hypothetical protein DT23_16730 [Thioclava indica]|uniref:Uncharacterized protein n=1 Tax=Thioclava indica TaxID=1353528 RepID=A0A074K9F3_9RHOB|nr:hypothetical protein DT23_16730 [Thioclava indica]
MPVANARLRIAAVNMAFQPVVHIGLQIRADQFPALDSVRDVGARILQHKFATGMQAVAADMLS